MKQFKLDSNIKLSKTFKPKQIAYSVINTAKWAWKLTEGGVDQMRQVKQRGGKKLVVFPCWKKKVKVRWRHESKVIVKTGNEWVSTSFPLSRLEVLGSIHLKDLLLCSKANSTMSPINTSLDYQLISPHVSGSLLSSSFFFPPPSPWCVESH